MTIEEKAKAFDEVLERVKPLYEWAKKDDSPMWSTYEYLFPQLAESEDERIRKEIIEYLKLVDKGEGDYAHPMVSGWIAWLEKQKEHKPAEWSEEDERMRNRLIDRLNWITYNTRTDGTSPNITFFDEIDWLKSLRSQPHWKPSEDEVRLINTSISFLKDFADKGYENAVECIDWLKSKSNGNSCK